jgi:hypothetical protein
MLLYNAAYSYGRIVKPRAGTGNCREKESSLTEPMRQAKPVALDDKRYRSLPEITSDAFRPVFVCDHVAVLPSLAAKQHCALLY